MDISIIKESISCKVREGSDFWKFPVSFSAKKPSGINADLSRFSPYYINGNLVFDVTPGVDEFKECLNRLISS